MPVYWEITDSKYNTQLLEVFVINFNFALVDEHTQQIVFLHTKTYSVLFPVKSLLQTAFECCTACSDM